MDEVQSLLAHRRELEERAATLQAGPLHDELCFEIGEIDLRLRELWSGEDSGVKQVTFVAPPLTEDRATGTR